MILLNSLSCFNHANPFLFYCVTIELRLIRNRCPSWSPKSTKIWRYFIIIPFMAGSFAHPSLSFIKNLKTSFLRILRWACWLSAPVLQGLTFFFSKLERDRWRLNVHHVHLYFYSRDTLTCQEEQFLSNMRDGQLPYSLTSFVYFQLNVKCVYNFMYL